MNIGAICAQRVGTLVLVASVFVALSGCVGLAQDRYEIIFSTYLGGAKWEQGRDIVTDAEGNIYVVGCVTSSEQDGFPVTPGVYASRFNTGGKEVGTLGAADGFVAKLAPDGQLLWCTYLGGPNYDRCYSVALDPHGNPIICGRAGPGFPTTPGTFQPEWSGSHKFNKGDLYGAQNGFVCKLSQDGQRLLWSTNVGTGHLCRGMTVDEVGDIYVAIGRDNTVEPPVPEPAWFRAAFANAFQKSPRGGKSDLAIVKIQGDGTKVLWATWLCGSGEEREESCIRVDAQHNVYVATSTTSPDMPVTGCYDNSYHGGGDAYYAKLSPDGARLLYGTYLGGQGIDGGNETHSFFVDRAGNAYGTVITTSPDFPITNDKGVYDNGHRGPINIGVIKLSPAGNLLLAMIIGSTGEEKVESMTVDANGCPVVGGFTSAKDFPTTPGAFSRQHGGGKLDAFLLKLAADFKTLQYSTYLGGDGDQFIRGVHVDALGRIYAVGSTTGDWPTQHAFQNRYAGSDDTRWVNGDVIIMKLAPVLPAK